MADILLTLTAVLIKHKSRHAVKRVLQCVQGNEEKTSYKLNGGYTQHTQIEWACNIHSRTHLLEKKINNFF